jgi:hypothetical protein
MPALPLDEAGKYVAAAYLVFLALLLIYFAIMGAKLARVERDLAELNSLAAGADDPGVEPSADPAAPDTGPGRPLVEDRS